MANPTGHMFGVLRNMMPDWPSYLNLKSLLRREKTRLITTGAKEGATGTVVVGAGVDDASLFTVAASQTAATAVVPITGLEVGEIITGFHLIGQVESGGNTATVDAALYSITAAAADLSTGAVSGAAITQVSVAADTALTSANAGVSGLSVTVAADTTYFVLITVTTAAATDVDMAGVAITSNL